MDEPNNVQAITDLLEHASQLKFKDHNAVRQVATQALVAAQALNHTALAIEASCELAWCDISNGKISEGIEIGLKALTLAREHNLTAMEGRAMGMIGLAFATSGNLYDALQVFDRQKDLAIAALDYKQLAGVLSDIASAHDRLGNYQLALDILLQAHEIAETYPVGIVYDYVLLNIAETYHNIQQPEKSRQVFRDLLQRIQGRGYDVIEVIAHVNLGKVLLAMGDSTGAIRECNLAWDIAHKTTNPRLKMQGQLGFFLIEQARGFQDEALERLKNIIALCDEYHQDEHKLGVLRVIKNIQLEQGDTAAALETYRQIDEFIDKTLLGQIETRISILRAVNEVERAWAQVKFERERAERLEREIQLQHEMEEQHLLAERHRLSAEHQRDLFRRKEAIILRLSHEIRNPLAVISGANELVQRHHSKMTMEQILGHSTQIQEQVKRISLLLNEVLTAVNLDEPPVL
jgi:tetratricopeptide (TPR) repeat protein